MIDDCILLLLLLLAGYFLFIIPFVLSAKSLFFIFWGYFKFAALVWKDYTISLLYHILAYVHVHPYHFNHMICKTVYSGFFIILFIYFFVFTLFQGALGTLKPDQVQVMMRSYNL